MIYRPSDCGCEQSHHPNSRCCCIPLCCSPWQRPEFPQPPGPIPPRPGTALNVLSTVNTTPQTVAAGGTLPFTTNTVSIGNAISHSGTSPNTVLSMPGIYRVLFNGTVSPLTTAELPDNISLELTLNGSPVPGAAASETFTAASDESSMAFHAIIEVTNVPATLSVTAANGAVVAESALSVEYIGAIPAPVIPPLTQTPYPYFPMM